MSLAIFDLDNTLIDGDSDYLWGRYLCENGIVDEETYRLANEKYYQQYVDGTLDIFEFLEFAFTPLAKHTYSQLTKWRAEYIQQKIHPIMLPAAEKLIKQHREQGDTILIITATNRFVTEPIAELLGIENLIATEPEIVDGEFTGGVSDVPAFQNGKVTRLNAWLADHNESLEGSVFYSDSRNDLPLLEKVDTAIAVNPDPTLETIANERGWKIITLR